MGALSCCAAKLAAPIILVTIISWATPAFAGTSQISAADTAWMIVATALVLMMTIPGLALFYSGMKASIFRSMARHCNNLLYLNTTRLPASWAES
jgi:Amt family ammonium transporter